jgi:hypothetical protein
MFVEEEALTPSLFESKVEAQCSIITKTDSEFWETRNKVFTNFVTPTQDSLLWHPTFFLATGHGFP